MRLINTSSGHTFIKVIFIGFLMLISLSSCSDENTPTKSRSAAQHEVKTQTVRLQEIRQHFMSSATVEAIQSLNITNQLAAQVKQVKVDVSDHVKKGDVLITLDDSIIKAELIKSQAQLKQNSLDLKRLQNLVKNKLSSDDEIAKAQTAVNIAQANVSIQQSRYNYSRIRAPFDGIISQRLVSDSDTLSLHQHLLTLINTQQLNVQASVSAGILNKIHLGDRVKIRCGNIQLKTHINRLYPAIDHLSQQGQIEVQWENTQHNIKPGQLCKLNIIGRAQQRLMIPNAAIQYDTSGAYVFIAAKKAIKTPITIGLKLKNFSEVLDGLNDKQTIISAGLLNLSDGDNININTTK